VEDNQKTIRRLVRTIAIGVLLFPAAGIPQDDPVSKIDRCRQVAAAEPNTGAAVYRSGLCFESIRDLGDAANAYSRALELQFQSGTTIVRRASIFLLTGQYERALNAAQAINQAQRFAAQGCTNPEYHQLDFLAGEWELQSEGRTSGASRIQPILHACALLEESNTQDDTVLSFIFYDPVSRRWFQNGASRYGKGEFELSGEFTDGVMHLSGTTKMQRSTLERLSTNRVKRIDEASSDGGNTWTVAHDLLYTRRK
jgi:tetratricopeptide (TPR) repeat protein